MADAKSTTKCGYCNKEGDVVPWACENCKKWCCVDCQQHMQLQIESLEITAAYDRLPDDVKYCWCYVCQNETLFDHEFFGERLRIHGFHDL